MQKNLNNTIYLLPIIILILSLLWLKGEVRADTTSSAATVDTVVNPLTSSGGGDSDSAPSITDVTTSPKMNSAQVRWTATDDNNVESCDFNYSTGINYNLTESVTEISPDRYEANPTNLSASTTYNFKITCYDAVQQTQVTSQFETLSAALVNLEILAQPEKRVSKPNGNFDVGFTLLLINPDTDKVVFTLEGETDSTGVFNQQNVKIPGGSGYEAILKGESHLAKKIVGINIVDGPLNLDFTDQGNSQLLAGDVAGTGLKDNFVDVLDISAILFTLNTADKESDLNRDGVVDVLDISILFDNFNQSGDPIPSQI